MDARGNMVASHKGREREGENVANSADNKADRGECIGTDILLYDSHRKCIEGEGVRILVVCRFSRVTTAHSARTLTERPSRIEWSSLVAILSPHHKSSELTQNNEIEIEFYLAPSQLARHGARRGGGKNSFYTTECGSNNASGKFIDNITITSIIKCFCTREREREREQLFNGALVHVGCCAICNVLQGTNAHTDMGTNLSVWLTIIS